MGFPRGSDGKESACNAEEKRGVGRKEKREPLVFVLEIWNKHVSGYGIKWRRTKEPLDESERESEKVGLKLNIQKTKIMASGPITSWEIEGETVETVSDFIFGGLQNHCRWWLQPWN